MSDTRYWNMKECSEYLELEEKTLRNLCANGKGPPFTKYAGRYRFLVDQVKLWEIQNTPGYIHERPPQLSAAAVSAVKMIHTQMDAAVFRQLDADKQDAIIDAVVKTSADQMVSRGYALPPLVSLAAFAGLLNIEPTTLRKNIRVDPASYPIPVATNGNKINFRRDDVVKHLKLENQIPFFENIVELTEPIRQALAAILKNQKGA